MKNFGRYVFIAVMLLQLVVIGCASLPANVERPVSYALRDTQDTAWAIDLADEKAANPGKSGFHLLGQGKEAFLARVALIHYAERSVDVQYFHFHDDLVGHLFTEKLLKAADRGVRVRILVDDMDLEGRDKNIRILSAYPNVEMRIFNPFDRKRVRKIQFVTRLGSVTRRMHNKSFTVDGQLAIIGGRNIGNEYFQADPSNAFADLDVMVIGPAVQDVLTAFDRYWNSELAYPVPALIEGEPTADEIKKAREELKSRIADQETSAYVQMLKDTDLFKRIKEDTVFFKWGEAVLVYDLPEKVLHGFDETEYHLIPKLKPYIEALQDEFIVISPYFVPGKSGTAFLLELVERGVRVRILTNSLASNDVPAVHAGYSDYRMELLAGGVEIYELNKRHSLQREAGKQAVDQSHTDTLHAKTFVLDRKQMFIGSLNLDPRSAIHNTEIGLVISCEEMAQGFGEWFDRDIDKLAFRLELKESKGQKKILWHGLVDGKPATLTDEPHAGSWLKFKVGLFGILPIESQL
jgi:putative cardiolipin synthase